MNNTLQFHEVFYDCLNKTKNAFDVSLIYLIHIIKSNNISEIDKHTYIDELTAIGTEANSFLTSVKLNEIDDYTIYEIEKRVIKEMESIQERLLDYRKKIDKRTKVEIDEDAAFSIKDILEKLSEVRMYEEYGLTKDKVHSLLSVGRFITTLYENQAKEQEQKEDRLQKDLYQLKQMAFLQLLHNSHNENPEFFFMSLELIKKMKNENINVTITESTDVLKNVNAIVLNDQKNDGFTVRYSFDGELIDSLIKKEINSGLVRYRITGKLEIDNNPVEYRISESIMENDTEIFERLLGLSFLYSQYEKAYIEYNDKKSNGKNTEKGKENLKNSVMKKLLG